MRRRGSGSWGYTFGAKRRVTMTASRPNAAGRGSKEARAAGAPCSQPAWPRDCVQAGTGTQGVCGVSGVPLRVACSRSGSVTPTLSLPYWDSAKNFRRLPAHTQSDAVRPIVTLAASRFWKRFDTSRVVGALGPSWCPRGSLESGHACIRWQWALGERRLRG